MGKWVSILGLVLILSANLSYGGELSPVSTSSEAKAQRWGIGIHGGYFGVPDFILDKVFVEHPSVSGSTFGIEARYYGDKGPDRVFNWLFSLDYGKFSGDGYWRAEEGDDLEYGKIDVSLISLTATALWSILPTKPVNPYIGIGLGVGLLKGTGKSKDEPEESVSATIPVLHIPIGLNIKASDKFHISIEGGFRDGFYAGGGARILF